MKASGCSPSTAESFGGFAPPMFSVVSATLSLISTVSSEPRMSGNPVKHLGRMNQIISLIKLPKQVLILLAVLLQALLRVGAI